MLEYKAVVYREGLIGSLFLGQSEIDPGNFTQFLNEYAEQGWGVVAIEREMRRMLLFWSREAFLVLLDRSR